MSGESVKVLEGGETARVGEMTGGETARRGVTEATDDEADDVSNCIELPASRSSGSCCSAKEGESAVGDGNSKGNGAGGFVTDIVGKGGRGADRAFVTLPNGSWAGARAVLSASPEMSEKTGIGTSALDPPAIGIWSSENRSAPCERGHYDPFKEDVCSGLPCPSPTQGMHH